MNTYDIKMNLYTGFEKMKEKLYSIYENRENIAKNIYSYYEITFPWVTLFVVSVLHIVLLLAITLLMILSQLFRLLFIGWCKFMDLIDRKRIIMDREVNEPYIIRYYLFLRDRDETFPFNLFLHNIVRSDNDELHDHPWGYFTLILCGGYFEHLKLKDAETNEDKVVKIWRGPGFYQTVSSSHIHRIELDNTKSSTWTLFVPFKKEKDWGFYTKDGFVESEEYLENKKKK